MGGGRQGAARRQAISGSRDTLSAKEEAFCNHNAALRSCLTAKHLSEAFSARKVTYGNAPSPRFGSEVQMSGNRKSICIRLT